MRLLLLTVFCTLCLTSQKILADKDRGVYVGAGIDLMGVGAEDVYRNGVTFKVGEAFIGYKYNAFLGAELRAGRSFSDEVIAYDNDSELAGFPEHSDSGIDNFISAYYRAELANEIAKVYLLVGGTRLQTTSVFEDGTRLEINDSSISYGVGFGLWLDERMNLNFEYKKLVDTDADAFRCGSINADYRF